MLDDNKTQKMVEIAKMYYEEELTQNEIAKRLGVSRPLLSKMLVDAKEAGIVTIQIHSPFVSNEFLMEEIRKIRHSGEWLFLKLIQITLLIR